MVATYQKVKNSLPFQWPLNSFHWPFIDEKQSMFTFALALFAGHTYFSLHFQPLSAFRGKRKKEYGRKHSQRKPLTTITCVRRRVSNWSLCLLCSMLIIFSKRKCISKSWRRLMNYKPENRKTGKPESPDLSLSLTVPKIFPDFFKNSLTFPWPWKIFVFPWHFPDRGHQDITKNNSLRKINVTRSQYWKHIGHVCHCSNTTTKMLFGKSTCRRPYKRDPWNRY